MKKVFCFAFVLIASVVLAVSCSSSGKKKVFRGEFEKYEEVPVESRLKSGTKPRVIRVNSLSAAATEILDGYYVLGGVSKKVSLPLNANVLSSAEKVYGEMASKNGYPDVIYEASEGYIRKLDSKKENLADYQAYFFYPMSAEQRVNVAPGLVVSGSSDDAGVKVEKVYRPSPVADSGIEKGDMLLQINGKSVNTINDYYSAVSAIKDNSFVSVVYIRDNIVHSKSFVFKMADMFI